MAGADACDAGGCGLRGPATQKPPAPAPGRRRPEPRGCDRPAGRIARHPQPRRPLARQSRPRTPGARKKGPLGHPPQQARLQPSRARTGLPGSVPNADARRPGSAPSKAAALRWKRNTRETRVCHKSPTELGRRSGQKPSPHGGWALRPSREAPVLSASLLSARLLRGLSGRVRVRAREQDDRSASPCARAAALFKAGPEREEETRK